MTVIVEFAWEDGADQSLGLPAFQTSGAAGADLCANLTGDAQIILAPMQRALVPTGLRMAIPQGFEAQIRPRSGLALKHGVTLANAPGTIDSDYRGPLGVILINLGDQAFAVTHGMRIAQMIIGPVIQPDLVAVPSLDVTKRGVGGFGSTGQ
ncbi:dUTP diphosphatase [Yoonia sp.]|uniref:dUTP diphosphatase n=1 Tax=Yoonia sp. TaxID=2212373 RepID=UPI0023B4386F